MKVVRLRWSLRDTAAFLEGVESVVRDLSAGALAAFPTDTVWGLGCMAGATAAIERIYRLKGREADVPIACLVGSTPRARAEAGIWPSLADELARRHWPGPLTLVLPTGGVTYPAVQRAGPTLGLRVPAASVLRAILEVLGEPLAATSANTEGRPPLQSADDVVRQFGEGIDLLIDTDDALSGTASTVVCWLEGRFVVVRSGAVALEPRMLGVDRGEP